MQFPSPTNTADPHPVGVPPIIVIGMHRSGTSLVSRLLQTMGIHMGADTTRTDESRFFREINRHFMHDYGANWYTPEPLLPVLEDPTAVGNAARQFRRSVSSNDASLYWGTAPSASTRWGWKDPRNTITLPVWLQLYPEAFVIHVVRNGIDVADSLVRRSRIRKQIAWTTRLRRTAEAILPAKPARGNVMPFAQRNFRNELEAFDLWRSYMEVAGQVTQMVPRDRLFTIRFEDLAAAPVKHLKAIAEFIEVSHTEETLQQIASSINSSRAWSFTSDKKLADFAVTAILDSQMKKFGYSSDTAPATSTSVEVA